MKHVFILGAGSFGTSLAVMAEEHCGVRVTLWSYKAEEAALLAKERVHPLLLPGVKMSEKIVVTASLEGVKDADLVLIATPSGGVRETARRLRGILPPQVPVACVSKGLEPESYKTMSTVIEEELPQNPAVALSGPSHAEELARGYSTTIVSASRNTAAAELVQDLLMNPSLRIYVSDDIIGVELGGALKNIIAVAAGILHGLGLAGDNTMAALMTRGITEIARLGIVLGAKAETFAGLSGIGDLIVTCSSVHSRNRRYGTFLGQGKTHEQALAEVGMTVEGYPITKNAYELSEKHNIYMPITQRVYRVLYKGEEPKKMMNELMALPKRHESETIWLLTK